MANLLLCASSSFSRILVRRNRGCQDSLVFVEASYFVRSFNEFGCLTFFLTSRSRMSSRRISQDKSDWLIERDGGMEMVQSFAYSYDIGNQVRFASQCWALIFYHSCRRQGVVFVFAIFYRCEISDLPWVTWVCTSRKCFFFRRYSVGLQTPCATAPFRITPLSI